MVLINDTVEPLQTDIEKNTQEIQKITGGVEIEGSILNIVNKAISDLHLDIQPDNETIIETNGKLSVNKVSTDILSNGDMELVLFSGDAVID